MAPFLYCFPSSCHSFTLLKRKVMVIFSLSPLRATTVIVITLERAIKKSKELIEKRMERRLRVITLQGAIEKGPIKSKIISYFGSSNNDYICLCICLYFYLLSFFYLTIYFKHMCIYPLST